MVYQLDVKDRKILFELDEDSRQPLSYIAKKVRLSKEAVYYRIQNLERQKVISSYSIAVSLAKLSLLHVKIAAKFQNIFREKKDEIITYLVSHANTNWVASAKGNFDILAGFVVRDLQEFARIREEFVNLYSEYIHDLSISFMLEYSMLGRKYLTGKSQQVSHYIGSTEEVDIDKQDYNILNLLSSNTRLKTTEIASRLKLTPRIVAYRIMQMEKKGIIQKYTISLNHALLGLSYFKAFIRLRSAVKKQRLLSYLANHPHCVFNMEVLADWNLEPEYEVFSNREYYDAVEELETEFSDMIMTVDTALIDREHKFKLLPDLITLRI